MMNSKTTRNTREGESAESITATMQKRVETKDDGRLLIYYSFDSDKTVEKKHSEGARKA